LFTTYEGHQSRFAFTLALPTVLESNNFTVACFYIQPRFIGVPTEDNFYRAIYLEQRSLKDLVDVIATKSRIEASKVLRTIQINKKGLHILIDDDSVQEIPEGQEMVAEFKEIGLGLSEGQEPGDFEFAETFESEGYELRLLF
jgi:hypothetical protein